MCVCVYVSVCVCACVRVPDARVVTSFPLQFAPIAPHCFGYVTCCCCCACCGWCSGGSEKQRCLVAKPTTSRALQPVHGGRGCWS